MLKQPMVFIATSDPARAREFYEKTLGLDFIADEPFALVFRTGQSVLRIQKVEEVRPPQHTVLGWEVDDVGQTVASLKERGVTFERYPHLPQDDDGVWEAPDGTWIAWFRDPEGNTLSIAGSASGKTM